MSQQGGHDSLYQNLPERFKNFLHKENLICSRLEFSLHVQSLHDDKHNLVDSVFRDLTHKTMKHLSHIADKCLVQFWKAEEVINVKDSDKRHFHLTTRNQPFLLTSLWTKVGYNHMDVDGHPYCSYWSEMRDVIITGDGDGGAIGRAFQNKRMELAPNISYYSDSENPHGYRAESCGIFGALAIPMFDKFRHAVGVVELVSDCKLDFWEILLPVFLSCKVTCLACCKAGLAEVCGSGKKKFVDIHVTLSKIKGLMELVAVNHDVIFCQTWILCRYCNSLFTSERVGHEISDIKLGDSVYNDQKNILSEAESICILQKGEGIVGKAASSSNNLVYCEDVSKLSIVEYPFAHVARDCGLSACFAVSLLSDHLRDQVYVLELFLAPSYVEGKDLNATLVPILQTMMNNFQTFKFASGEEVGRYLSVQVVDAIFVDQFKTLEIHRLDPTDDHMIEMDLIDNWETLPIEEGHVAIDSLEKQHTNAQTFGVEGEGNLPSKTHQMGRINISKKELMAVRNLKRVDAANRLSVSVSTFKRVCREYNIRRWPPRKTNIDHPSSSSNSAQAYASEEFQGSSPTAHDENLVTIKAKHGYIFIKFQLSISSGIDKFNEEVSKRLKLEIGKFIVKYQDEDNDWILVACDDDLRYYISNSTLLGKNTLEIVAGAP